MAPFVERVFHNPLPGLAGWLAARRQLGVSSASARRQLGASSAPARHQLARPSRTHGENSFLPF
eukprot:gene20153-biopygen11574